jgi:hypothetical protein
MKIIKPHWELSRIQDLQEAHLIEIQQSDLAQNVSSM